MFQKILLVQNPEPYLEQKKDNHTAVEMINATLSWTRPASGLNLANSQNGQVKGHREDENGPSKSLPTLRNISFTLPKVRCKPEELIAVMSSQLGGK